MAKKKKSLAPRCLRMKRGARLSSARRWLATHKNRTPVYVALTGAEDFLAVTGSGSSAFCFDAQGERFRNWKPRPVFVCCCHGTDIGAESPLCRDVHRRRKHLGIVPRRPVAGTTAEEAELDFALDQAVEKATRVISHCS